MPARPCAPRVAAGRAHADAGVGRTDDPVSGGTEEEGADAIHAQLVAVDTKLHQTIGTPRMVTPKAKAAPAATQADDDWRIIRK